MLCQKPLCASTYGAQTFVEFQIQIVVECPCGRLSHCSKSRLHEILLCQKIFCHIRLCQKKSTTIDGFIKEYFDDVWRICFGIYIFVHIHTHAHEITFLQIHGLFNMVSTLLKKMYLWKMLGFCLTLNIGTTFGVYLEVISPLLAISRFFQPTHQM